MINKKVPGSGTMASGSEYMKSSLGVHARVGFLDHDSDPLQSVKRGIGTVELKLPHKLAAIQLDKKIRALAIEYFL